MRSSIVFACLLSAPLLAPAGSHAAIVQTVGAGSAVTAVQASAFFESALALNGNPYLEGTMSFSRTNLSFNNNGCGFAGCLGHQGFQGFSGNYMYGVGTGTFEISTVGSAKFIGIEFMVGTGFFSTSVRDINWTAYDGVAVVGSGSLGSLAAGSVIGFSGGPFNRLAYTSGQGGLNAPAFDNVYGQFSGAVPEPSTWAMMLIGFAGLAFAQRRKAKLQTA
jgi:hypothetical protein